MQSSDRYINQCFKPGYTYITAHTGCEKTPPNSIEHIHAALLSGAEIIEVDIHKDGDLLYLSHDEDPNPGSRPALEECFKIVSPQNGIKVNCDVKRFGLVKPVVELALKYGMTDRIHFTGQVGPEDQQYLKDSNVLSGWWNSIFPSARDYENIKYAMDFLNQYNRDKVICVHYKMLNDEILALAKDNGYLYTVWTVDEDEDIVKMLKLGLVNITTNRPVRALELRKEILGY